jgi:hypothetical protein
MKEAMESQYPEFDAEPVSVGSSLAGRDTQGDGNLA